MQGSLTSDYIPPFKKRDHAKNVDLGFSDPENAAGQKSISLTFLV